MKGIILILVYSLVWLPTESRLDAINSESQEPSKHNKQPHVIIDEILGACGPLFFKSNSGEITTDHEKCLLEISLNLRLAENYYLVVDVHRTSSESDEISTVRVKKVRDKLVKQKGIDSARLIVRDFMDSCPHETDEANFNARLELWYWREKEKVGSIPKQCASGAKPSFRIIE